MSASVTAEEQSAISRAVTAAESVTGKPMRAARLAVPGGVRAFVDSEWCVYAVEADAPTLRAAFDACFALIVQGKHGADWEAYARDRAVAARRAGAA